MICGSQCDSTQTPTHDLIQRVLLLGRNERKNGSGGWDGDTHFLAERNFRYSCSFTLTE